MHIFYLIILFTTFFPGITIFAAPRNFDEKQIELYLQDTIKDNQVLYNGRIWRNRYARIKEDQFLFSRDFIEGSLTVRGETFKGIQLKYDIFKDELLSPVQDGVIQLNKEMIDSFRLSFGNRNYKFIKIQEDSLNTTKSFFDVLYEGKTSLYVRHFKKIDKLAVEGQYDKFYQINKVYVTKGNKFYPITGKKDLMEVLKDKSVEIKDFLKKNKLRVTEKLPDSFIPVIMYYDNLMH